MIRTLLATTAIATLLTAGAIAQDTTTPAAPADATPMAPATDTTTPAAPADTTTPADTTAPATTTTDTTTTTTTTDTTMSGAGSSILATGYTVTDVDNLASEIIGRQVYSSTASDAEHIGDVNNLVLGENGQVAAVIIGVGGFLGIGEKNVAVNYSELEWVVAEDNSERFVLPTTKETLEAAPDFVSEDQTPPPNEAPANNGTMAPADGGAMAPADGGAMAPAAPATTTP